MGTCFTKEKVCKLVCPECKKLHQIPTGFTGGDGFRTELGVVQKYDKYGNDITPKVNTCTSYYKCSFGHEFITREPCY